MDRQKQREKCGARNMVDSHRGAKDGPKITKSFQDSVNEGGTAFEWTSTTTTDVVQVECVDRGSRSQ